MPDTIMTNGKSCPSCRSEMEALLLESQYDAALTIDACWSCQLIWFDHFESTALSATSVIALFKRIHEAQFKAVDGLRNTVSSLMKCPICPPFANGLKLTNDFQKNGRFSYYRCDQGHGRAISFTQFLIEKNFIRSLNLAEIKSLSIRIQQVRCSSCGGSIDLTHDTSCSHCGSAISVLDNEAVEKALTALEARQKIPLTADRVEQKTQLNAALQRMRETSVSLNRQQTSSSGPLDWLVAGEVLCEGAAAGSDLVGVGIGALVALFD